MNMRPTDLPEPQSSIAMAEIRSKLQQARYRSTFTHLHAAEQTCDNPKGQDLIRALRIYLGCDHMHIEDMEYVHETLQDAVGPIFKELNDGIQHLIDRAKEKEKED